MDPMAWIIFFEISENHAVSLNRGILDAIQLVKQYLTSQDLLAGTDPQVKFSIHLLVIWQIATENHNSEIAIHHL